MRKPNFEAEPWHTAVRLQGTVSSGAKASYSSSATPASGNKPKPALASQVRRPALVRAGQLKIGLKL